MTSSTPNIADLVPADMLAATQANAEQSTITALEEKLIPILRNATNYKGEVTVTAKNTISLTIENGQTVIKNDVKVGLTFPPIPYNDIFEDVHRTIFQGLFEEAIKRF